MQSWSSHSLLKHFTITHVVTSKFHSRMFYDFHAPIPDNPSPRSLPLPPHTHTSTSSNFRLLLALAKFHVANGSVCTPHFP